MYLYGQFLHENLFRNLRHLSIKAVLSLMERDFGCVGHNVWCQKSSGSSLLTLCKSPMANGQEEAVEAHETTPLLPGDQSKPVKWGKSVLYRALFCSFVVSASFGVTQVP